MIAIALYFENTSYEKLNKKKERLIYFYSAKNKELVLEAPSLHLTLFAGMDNNNIDDLVNELDKIKESPILIYSSGIGVFLRKKIILFFRWRHNHDILNLRFRIKELITKYLPSEPVNGYGENDWVAKTTWLSILKIDSDLSEMINQSAFINLDKHYTCDKLVLIDYNDEGEERIIFQKYFRYKNGFIPYIFRK